MGLDAEEKAARIALLREARVPERAHNMPLSRLGAQGENLRGYLKGPYRQEAAARRGAVIVGGQPGLSLSFARDIALSGASTLFYYMQTFATRSADDGMPHSFVIEWFEQDADCPFTARERFGLETRFMQLIDDGVILYLFTSVPLSRTKWWSRQFAEELSTHCRTIGANDGDWASGERTSIGTGKVSRPKDARPNPRVAIR